MKQAKTRLYVVGSGNGARLIRARHPDVAKSFATRNVNVRVATQDDIVTLVSSGVKPELARPDNAELPLDAA